MTAPDRARSSRARLRALAIAGILGVAMVKINFHDYELFGHILFD